MNNEDAMELTPLNMAEQEKERVDQMNADRGKFPRLSWVSHSINATFDNILWIDVEGGEIF